jgi:PP-loop superfamily ATP-utilizing enzyme
MIHFRSQMNERYMRLQRIRRQSRLVPQVAKRRAAVFSEKDASRLQITGEPIKSRTANIRMQAR